MKKSAVGIAALAIVCLFGVPYVTGSLAESETHRIIGEFNKKSTEYGTTDIVSYERGVRSSHIVYEYELPAGLSSALGLGDKISYECDYEHGFAGIDYSCDFLSNPSYKEFVDQYLSGENPLLITGGMSAFGGFTQHISTKAIDSTMDGGEVIKLAASDIAVESDGDFSSFVIDADIGVANLQGKDRALKIGGSTLSMNAKLTDMGLFSGDYSVVVSSLKAVVEQENLSLDGLTFNGVSIERGAVMDTSVQASVERFSSDAADGLAIESMKVDADFLGVNSRALVDYQDFARTLQADLIANVEQGGQAEVDPNQMMALLPVVEKMLQKGLNFKLAMSAGVNGKPNSAELDLKLLEKTTFTQLSAFMFDPESLLKSIDFRIRGSLNKDLIGRNPAVRPILDKSPLFVSENDVYTLNIKLAEQAKVNGKKVSFQELQGMIMSSMM